MTAERAEIYENQRGNMSLHSPEFVQKAVDYLEAHGWVRHESEHNWVRKSHADDPSVDLSKNDYFTMDAYSVAQGEQETADYNRRWEDDGKPPRAYYSGS